MKNFCECGDEPLAFQEGPCSKELLAFQIGYVSHVMLHTRVGGGFQILNEGVLVTQLASNAETAV